LFLTYELLPLLPLLQLLLVSLVSLPLLLLLLLLPLPRRSVYSTFSAAAYQAVVFRSIVASGVGAHPYAPNNRLA
jgi:hypothetical protein